VLDFAETWRQDTHIDPIRVMEGREMNAADRKQVSDLVSKLEELNQQFEDVKTSIEELAEAEQEKFDNLTEGLQASEKGQAIEAAAGALIDAASADSIQDAIDALGNIE
jgi:septal ring factor EnvC (AmiA/AmiB activator)